MPRQCWKFVDATGKTTYAYKALGTAGALQVASIDGPLTNDTLTFSYDDLGRAASRLINGFGVSSLGFDGLGRLTQEINETGTFGYTYDAESARLATSTYPNGQVSSYAYLGNTADRRLQTIHHQTSGSATISKFDYTYNAVGNILTRRQQAGTGATLWHYGYDTADQLTAAVKKSTDPTPTVLKRYAYGYDVAGNRSVEQIDDTVVGASHNALNRLSSQQPSGMLRVTGAVSEAATVTIAGKPAIVAADSTFDGTVSIASGTSSFSVVATDTNNNIDTNEYEVENLGSSKSFTYDANGNLTADGTRTFEWDAENRLTAIVIGANRSEFTYDGLERRVRIVEKQSGTTVRDARFIWVGGAIGEERLSTGEINRFFSGSEEHDGIDHYITRDHLGSVREVTNPSQVVLTRNEYDTYGRLSRLVGSVDSRFAFTGHYWHIESGLLLAQYRAYDANLGTWLSQDPIGFEGGLNFQQYALSNPVLYLDPDGLDPITGALSGARVGGMLGFAAGGPLGGLGGSIVGGIIGGLIVGGGAALIHNYFVKTPPYPGNDPTKSPGPDYTWKGRPGSTPGDGNGSYHNPGTKEVLRPDVRHKPPIGPHWDYRDPSKTWHRIFPDGSSCPK